MGRISNILEQILNKKQSILCPQLRRNHIISLKSNKKLQKTSQKVNNIKKRALQLQEIDYQLTLSWVICRDGQLCWQILLKIQVQRSMDWECTQCENSKIQSQIIQDKTRKSDLLIDFQCYILQKYLKIIQMTYQLSVNKPCHTRELRCLDYHAGVLVTGGGDNLVKIYSVKDEKIEQITTISIFQKTLRSIKINRNQPAQIFILAGCADGKIYGLDHSGNPLTIFQHDSPISSIDFINDEYFVTGSWDGKGIVWHIPSRKKISEYTNHKHAVAVYYSHHSDQVISGSQDKALASWNWRDGKQVKRVQGAHGDIIRQISRVPSVGFITCSNDQTLKLWTAELEEINHFVGQHSSYVYTVKSSGFGAYFSAGDDKSIKIWKNDAAVQTLQCPGAIWSLAVEESGQIYAGCSDGYLRVFSTNPQRKASQTVIAAFNKQILDSASKKSGMSAQQIKKLPTYEQMMKIKGKKQGQIRVSKNGLIPQAFMWQNNKWQKIGEVITESNQGGGGMSQSKYYPGDKYFEAGQYDYIFDVDDESGMHKQIPYNDGANALEAAQKYCMRQGLTKGYIEQIRKFLMQNSSKIPRSAVRATHQKEVPQSILKNTPQCIPIQYTDIKNPAAVAKKIAEFNNQISGPLKLNQRELEHCNRITTLLQSSKNYHTWKLDFKEMDTLKKLLQWPSEYKLPVWDVFRAFLCHYQSEALFSGLDAGFEIVSQLAMAIQKQNSQGFYALIFRTLTNVMIQNTNKNGIVKCGDLLFNSIDNFSKRVELKNKNLLTAVAGFLFNFSVTVFQKKIQNQEIISMYAKILNRRLQLDDDEQNRGIMLQAASNIIFKYQSKRDEFSYIKKYLGNNQVSQDLNLLLG